MFSTAEQRQLLGTDLYLKNAAIPGFPMLFFIPSGYPESQMLTQAQLTAATSSPPSSVPTGKVFGQTLKWSFLTYCIFTSSQLHPTDPRGDPSSAPNENHGWLWGFVCGCHHTTSEELGEAGLALQ